MIMTHLSEDIDPEAQLARALPWKLEDKIIPTSFGFRFDSLDAMCSDLYLSDAWKVTFSRQLIVSNILASAITTMRFTEALKILVVGDFVGRQ